jgi:hypothetical protein
VRGGFAHAGGADADVTRLIAKLPEIGRAEITQAALDAADELRQKSEFEKSGFALVLQEATEATKAGKDFPILST